MQDPNDIPDACLNDNHNFGQAGRCQGCGVDRVDTYPTNDRKTGGAGSLTQPLTDEDYRRERRKLEERAGQ